VAITLRPSDQADPRHLVNMERNRTRNGARWEVRSYGRGKKGKYLVKKIRIDPVLTDSSDEINEKKTLH